MSKQHLLIAVALLACLGPAPAAHDEGAARVDVALHTQAPASEEPAVESPALAPEVPPPPQAPAHSLEAVQGGILCWNEANDRLNDCAAIIHMRMRSARSHHRTFREELYYLHGDGRRKARNHAALRSDRATNPQDYDSRPWLGDVTADLHMPQGWNQPAADWPARAARLDALFRYVQRILDGEVRDPCAGRARRWGGEMDQDDVKEWQERGEVILECGNTANTFLGRT